MFSLITEFRVQVWILMYTTRSPSFSDTVGKIYIFQLKLGKFNFTSKHQTFTIPRIITEKQRPPLPDFFIHVGT